jgi:sRNA-binding carbon storage regulator CsrA
LSLVFKRKKGQSVRIGEAVVTVVDVGSGNARLGVGSDAPVWKNQGERLFVGLSTGLAMVLVGVARHGVVKLIIDAPQLADVWRGELDVEAGALNCPALPLEPCRPSMDDEHVCASCGRWMDGPKGR